MAATSGAVSVYPGANLLFTVFVRDKNLIVCITFNENYTSALRHEGSLEKLQ